MRRLFEVTVKHPDLADLIDRAIKQGMLTEHGGLAGPGFENTTNANPAEGSITWSLEITGYCLSVVFAVLFVDLANRLRRAEMPDPDLLLQDAEISIDTEPI